MTTNWKMADDNCSLQPPSREVIAETALAMAQATIQGAINASGISRADLAREMERPPSFISKMLRGDHNLTIKTFARALGACGYELQLGYTPIEHTNVAEAPWLACEVTVSAPASTQTTANEDPNSDYALAA